MIRRVATVVAFAVLLTVTAEQAANAAACHGPRVFPSPDGHFVAQIAQRGHRLGCGESVVTISDRIGRRRAFQSYVSKDGEHGQVVGQAAWSPDSTFFVISLSSSGGHQAQHYPTVAYASRRHKFVNVESLRRNLYISDPHFQFQTDGRLVVTDLNTGRTVLDLRRAIKR